MPLYEYQCKSCHKLTERIQKFSDPPMAICPHCGGELEQLISAAAVRFKGAGWYVTDYAKKKGAPAASGNGDSASSASEDKSKSGETSKTETKPDVAKSESSSSSKSESSSTGKDAK